MDLLVLPTYLAKLIPDTIAMKIETIGKDCVTETGEHDSCSNCGFSCIHFYYLHQRLLWTKAAYDYMYASGETLLRNFPVQATIQVVDSSDSSDDEDDEDLDECDEKESEKKVKQ